MTALDLSPDHFEILVVRELRKAGLDVSALRVRRQAELAGEAGGYEIDLSARLHGRGEEYRVLIACRHGRDPIGREPLESLEERIAKAEAEGGLLFASSGYEKAAVEFAGDHGIALVRIVDGRVAHDTGGWGPPGHYPSWLPAHAAQVVRLGATGELAYDPVAANRPEWVLDRLRRARGEAG